MLPSACGDIDRAPTRAGQDVSAATGTPPHAHEIALRNSRDIGMATGILMGLHRITSQQAFHLLRLESQHSNRKLAEIATEVVETGALNARPRDPRSLGRAFPTLPITPPT